MKTPGFMFCFVAGVGVGLLLWIAIKPPRNWTKTIECFLATTILLIIGAIALPNFVSATSATCHSSCVRNLKQIQGAKATWAIEFKKAYTEVPKAADLFGETNYIRIEPTCPAGGTYTWGAVQDNPTCSIGGVGHSWPSPPQESSRTSMKARMALCFSAGFGAVLVAALLRQTVRMKGARSILKRGAW